MTTPFFDKYKHKVLKVDELQKLIGSFPRKKKVIMCHGVFDVVHPGHVRHLVYAKSKADILVVSITTDLHIKKGVYRPHIPEDLRALNLAAFEMVDYVIIDSNETPVKNIRDLKPDFFAKGFEYVSDGLPPATQEEVDFIQSYGGEIIFTPGDIVYSSSRFINTSPPQVKFEKLLLLLEKNDLSLIKLKQKLQDFKGTTVHVVGDTIVDSYTRTSLIGGQTKTPTFSVLKEGVDNYVGGAGIVAKHLRAAGAEVIFSTVLGKDTLGDFVLSDLERSGIKVNAVRDESRPTTNKNVFIASGYRLLKVDSLDNRPISTRYLSQLCDAISTTDAEVLVFSDFRHGIFNRTHINKLAGARKKGVFSVADSQVASRWGNITEFKNFDLITPNEREARFALATQDSTVGQLAKDVTDACIAGNLILKLGSKGIFCVYPDDGYYNQFSMDSFSSNVVDPVGAGDALLAYSTLSLFTTKSLVAAGVIGSVAAACECEIDGNVPIEPKDVETKLDNIDKQSSYG